MIMNRPTLYSTKLLGSHLVLVKQLKTSISRFFLTEVDESVSGSSKIPFKLLAGEYFVCLKFYSSKSNLNTFFEGLRWFCSKVPDPFKYQLFSINE